MIDAGDDDDDDDDDCNDHHDSGERSSKVSDIPPLLQVGIHDDYYDYHDDDFTPLFRGIFNRHHLNHQNMRKYDFFPMMIRTIVKIMILYGLDNDHDDIFNISGLQEIMNVEHLWFSRPDKGRPAPPYPGHHHRHQNPHHQHCHCHHHHHHHHHQQCHHHYDHFECHDYSAKWKSDGARTSWRCCSSCFSCSWSLS